MQIYSNVFDKVLFIGPDLNGMGGMQSVLKSYRTFFAPFHYIRSNSTKGLLMNIVVLAVLMVKLPYYRLIKKIPLLHVHVAADKSFIRKSIIIIWARILGFKVIYHSHASRIKDYAKKVGVGRIRSTLKRCQAVMVLSKRWDDYFRNEVGVDNVYVVDNIVDRAPVLPPGAHKDDGVLKLLFLGLIGDRKGLFDLLDVISENRKDYEGRLKLIVGGNGEIDRLKRYISKHSLESIVEFVGWVRGDKKQELLAWSDCLILPSYNEGLPIAILEAMSYGKAIISTNVGGIPDMLANYCNGFLSEPGDKKAIKRAVDFYISSPKTLKRHGDTNLHSLTNNYPENVAEKLIGIYSELLAERR